MDIFFKHDMHVEDIKRCTLAFCIELVLFLQNNDLLNLVIFCTMGYGIVLSTTITVFSGCFSNLTETL